MSELKRRHINEVMDMFCLTRGNMNWSQVYYADDADKVIAEKDEAIEEMEERIDELQKATDSAWSKVNAMYDELRHHKYKRCLAMAKWCEFYADSLRVKRNQCRYDEAELAEMYYIRCRRYRRWCQVWLELAEKFKEGV